MAEDNAFGEYLQQLREARGYSRQQLADAARLSYPYISQLERGFKTERGVKKKPSETALAQLAEPLGVRLEELARHAGVQLTGRSTARSATGPSNDGVRWHQNPDFTDSAAVTRGRSRNEAEQARTEVLPALRRLLATYEPATRLALLSELQAEAIQQLTSD